MFNIIGFFLSQSFKDFKRHFYLQLSVILIIFFSSFIFGVMLLFVSNLDRVLEKISSDIDITLYLSNDVVPGSEKYVKLQKMLYNSPAVAKVTYISSEEALKKFNEEYSEYNELVDFIGENPLPASFQIRLKDNIDDIKMHEFQNFISSLGKIDGIENVNITGEWIKRFYSFIAFIKLVAAIIILLIGVGVVFIIYNAIKITIHSRMVQIEIMRLIGATKFFIKGPFIFEGLWQGFIGAVFSIFGLYFVYSILKSNLEEAFSFIFSGLKFEFLDPVLITFIIIGGLLLGTVGSSLSTARFLRN
ncbi:MAG: ABC transporter permease [Candidatus Schekmanbacteria bacterium]|nr:MAG: ABC transporter permease [Candidatus Schekmanbacteria bacterium]